MEEVKAQGAYKDFKETLDKEFKRTSEGFVKIGYLLKIARDTEILYESGYSSVAEFAQAEYGLSKDIVSRYIAINDRYSEGGYSEHLQDRYQSYGVAKLAEMLTLPDAVIESMSPELTRGEIREIKKEIKEEEKTTDIEVMLEGKDEEMAEDLRSFIRQYLHDHKEEFLGLGDVINGTALNPIDAVMDVLAPSGAAMKAARIRGIGKLMLSIRGANAPLELVNVRTNEKWSYTWEKCIDTIKDLFGGRTGKKGWEAFYGEIFEEPTETAKIPDESEKTEPSEIPKVAPAQPAEMAEIPNGSKKTETAAVRPEETKEEPQIPGQMELKDYPEILPEPMKETGEMAKTLNESAILEEKKEELSEIPKVAPAQPAEMAEIPNEPQHQAAAGEGSETIETEEITEPERTTHQIRLDHKYFDAVSNGEKSFELRKNDRDYKTGDILQMMEFNEGRYTGRELKVEVTYILKDHVGLQEGYCIMAIAVFERGESHAGH